MSDGQYLNASNISFLSCLWAIKPASAEDVVQTLWTNLLATFFPPTSPYKIAIKSAVLSDSTMPDGVIFEIRNTGTGNPRDSRALLEKQIFMVECKRPSKDTDSEWALNGAPAQLMHYMEQTTNVPSNRMYGAVAIGTKVKFYRWDRTASPPLVLLHQDKIDLSESTHRRTFENMILYVRNYAWTWACS